MRELVAVNWSGILAGFRTFQVRLDGRSICPTFYTGLYYSYLNDCVIGGFDFHLMLLC